MSHGEPSRVASKAGSGRTLAVALLAAALAMTACSHSSTSSASDPIGARRTPAVVLRSDGQPDVRVEVEVARTPPERNQGLMYRTSLADGHGMLFLFEQPQPLTFWMHNTLIPLDMIFIGADGKVVGVVERAEPQTDDPRRVDGLSQFVLEVPGGWAHVHGVGPGTSTQFVDVE